MPLVWPRWPKWSAAVSPASSGRRGRIPFSPNRTAAGWRGSAPRWARTWPGKPWPNGRCGSRSRIYGPSWRRPWWTTMPMTWRGAWWWSASAAPRTSRPTVTPRFAQPSSSAGWARRCRGTSRRSRWRYGRLFWRCGWIPPRPRRLPVRPPCG